MIKKAIFGILVALMPLQSFAKTYKLEGMIGGEYPIEIELEEHYNGLFSGRYAYLSTLQRSGNLDCSWLDINPSHDNPAEEWTIRDCNLASVETWRNVKFSDRTHLTARMTNRQGKTYDITAHVTESNVESPSTISYFKEHLGDYVADFSMFSDPSIQEVFEDIMGASNFYYLTEIYQTQGPIEYTGGMFWASGFMAHQCCDPAALWAYDSYTDAFYIWIRKDGQDYWWSQSGSVPYKFQELVNREF